ncbi:MAG: sulfatase-like hydrolase/transferase [Actinomycetota bacterium]
MGPAATFFAAHGAGRREILIFTAAVLVVPAAVTLGALLVVRSVAPRAVDAVTSVLVGLLTALIIVPSVDRFVALSAIWFALAVAAIALVVSHIHHRRSEVRTLVRASATIPLMLATWFLFFAAVSSLVLPQPAVARPQARTNANVLFVIFDELPLAALTDSTGMINTARFPAFANLARRSTWYPRATTVAPWTHLAVPAMLSGTVPRTDATPTRRDFPKNLFTMLASTHELDVQETVTLLCTEDCNHQAGRGVSLYEDAGIVYLHTVLPDGVASDLLPPISNQWGDFRESESAVKRVQKEGTHSDQVAKFDALLDSVRRRRDGRQAVSFGHVLLPHLPFQYLPNGDVYDEAVRPPGLTDDWITWSDNRSLTEVARQRFLLQLKYVDRLIGQLISTLEATGSYDRTLLVVTSDHGLSFSPGASRRASPLTAENAADILSVPLFIKFPNQKAGVIDQQHAQTIDVLPTIADALDVGLPGEWRFDGRSLMSAHSDASHPADYVDPNPGVHPPAELNLSLAATPYHELFGDWRNTSDIYAWGPHWRLVRRNVTPSETSKSSVSAALLRHEVFANNRRRGFTPALVQLRFDRAPTADWFAVAMNGTIAGLGRTYEESGKHAGVAVVDPTLLRSGSNSVEGYLINASGGLSNFAIEPAS